MEQGLNTVTQEQVDNLIDSAPAQGTPVDGALNTVSQEQVDNLVPEGPSQVATEAPLQPASPVVDPQLDLKAKIKAVEDKGIEPEAIKKYLMSNGYSEQDTTLVREKWQRYNWDPDTPMEEAKDISDLYKDVHEEYSTTLKQVQGLWDEEKGKEARSKINSLNQSLSKKLVEMEYDAFVSPETGELMLRNEDGTVEEIGSDFTNRLFNTKVEIGGAITGAIAGARIGALAPGSSKALAIPLGAIGGSMMGASLGKGLDMTINAFQLKEDIESKLYMSQMKEAAIFDGVAGVLGAGMYKLGSHGLKKVMGVFDFIAQGNTNGAHKALGDLVPMISDDQAKELIKGFEELTGNKVPGKNLKEQSMSVMAVTQQGLESTVGSVAAVDPKLTRILISDIDDRAKSITSLIADASGEDVGKLIRSNLDDYATEVKTFYGDVKDIAAEAIDGTDFTFDVNKLALEPVMKNIEKGLADPTKKDQFMSFALKVADASESRQFSDLINLRQEVNAFKYKKTGLKKPELDALNTVINKIDGQINKAVKTYMPENGKAWIEQFGKAKTEYAKMKKMEDNLLFKALTKKGVTDDSIATAAKKYINSIDETFEEVMEKLPPKTKGKVESVVIKELTDRYTLGHATDKQAIHFPMLAEHLSRTNLTTPEGKYMKEVVGKYAEIFKNDPNLSKVSGNMAVPKFQSYLTVDPVMRAKYEMASAGFNFVKKFVPGEKANNLALMDKLSKLLDNPMSVKETDKFIRGIPKEQRTEVTQLVSNLRQAMVKTGQKPVEKDFKKMYKQSASGKMVVTDGKFGKGVYLVDKVKGGAPGGNIVGKEVNMSKMATLEDISGLLGKPVGVDDVRNIVDLQEKLQRIGFEGLQTDGKVMLFSGNAKQVKK